MRRNNTFYRCKYSLIFILQYGKIIYKGYILVIFIFGIICNLLNNFNMKGCFFEVSFYKENFCGSAYCCNSFYICFFNVNFRKCGYCIFTQTLRSCVNK